MIIDEEEYLAHYGVLRKSGRYPWGSGGTQNQRNRSFLDTVEGLKKDGMSEPEIADGFGLTTTQLRALKSIALNEQKQAQINTAQRLKNKGMSNVAIGEKMGINESSVRSLLAPGAQDKADVLQSTANMLRDQVAKKGMIDVGTGVESSLGISATKLSTAVAMLREEGYTYHTLTVTQLGTGKETRLKVLAGKDVSFRDVAMNKGDIQQITDYTDDGGRNWEKVQPPKNLSSKRVAVVYAEDGGSKKDGVIELRPGVKDLDLGRSSYAQVRILVDNSHYLKGMAIYNPDLPDGVDVRFNTNKSDTGNKRDAMKPIVRNKDGSVDELNMFGAAIKKGGQRGVLNVVNEEGNWSEWSRSLSSQFLSKQSPSLAKAQLNMTTERREADLAEILSLTNPSVRRKLLDAFAEDADSASVHLKAAILPRTANHVLLPVTSMKPTEIYAPNFKNGEKVVLVRHPHGGIFEIPELTVNNRNPEAKKLIGSSPKDAVGIHHSVAEKLSGADFDGDTVLVIPNAQGKVKTAPTLQGLKDFDPKAAYPGYPGMKRLEGSQMQQEMGKVSNLITDMSVKGASMEERARAVRHSMVVIDAEKHNLDYKASAEANGIAALKEKYQGKSNAGAATLISLASSKEYVPQRKLRPAKEGGPVDPKTGKLVFVETGKSYEKVDAKGNVTRVVNKEKVKKGYLTDDANTLSSGTTMEGVYAEHSNRLKALANEARRASVSTRGIPYDPSAKRAYADQVGSLNAKLNIAERNAPRERQAQLLANATVAAKKEANPHMDDADLKKIKKQALDEARIRTGAQKERIIITQDEWNAIQSGAISNHKLDQILRNADTDTVRKLATPRIATVMTSTKVTRAKAMLAQGYTQAEVAAQLGVPVSTIMSSLGE